MAKAKPKAEGKVKGRKFDQGPVDKSYCEHTPGAEERDYIKWHAWVAKMKNTHRQTQCHNCGLWVVWIKKGD
jgi:hypothetical protein